MTAPPLGSFLEHAADVQRFSFTAKRNRRDSSCSRVHFFFSPNGPNNSLKADEAAGTDVTVHVTKNGERVIVALNLKNKNY